MTTILMTAAVAASVNIIQDADAIKSKGTGTSQYGSSTNICGVQLCSEIPGGKAAWMEQQKNPTPVEPVAEEETMDETMEEETMDETMEEETMDETMEEETMDETMEEETMDETMDDTKMTTKAHGYQTTSGTMTSMIVTHTEIHTP